MAFDITCAVIFLLCVLIGYMKGIVRAALLVGCVTAAYYLSKPLASPIGGFIHRWTGLAVDVSLIAGQSLGGLAVYAVCSLVSDFLARPIERDEHGFVRSWNRHLGALVGLATGAALIFAGVCVADALVKSMPSRKTYLFRTLRSSRLRRYVSNVNPLRNDKGGKLDVLSDLSSLNYRRSVPALLSSGDAGARFGFTGAEDCGKIKDRGRGPRLLNCWRWRDEIPRRTGNSDECRAG